MWYSNAPRAVKAEPEAKAVPAEETGTVLMRKAAGRENVEKTVIREAGEM